MNGRPLSRWVGVGLNDRKWVLIAGHEDSTASLEQGSAARPLPLSAIWTYGHLMENRFIATGDGGIGHREIEILESISDAFYAVDRDWRFTYVNRKAEEWWGRARASLIGKAYWNEFPQAIGSAPYHALLQAAE